MRRVTLLYPDSAEFLIRCVDRLACPNCGNPTPRRSGSCCCGKCRVALHRWRQWVMGKRLGIDYVTPDPPVDRQVRRLILLHGRAHKRGPERKIGSRSLKSLRSSTHGLNRPAPRREPRGERAGLNRRIAKHLERRTATR